MPQTTPRPARSWTKRLLIALALLVVLAASFLVGLPFAVRYAAVRWLLAHGAQSADIEKININLFTGIAGVKGLQVRLDNDVVLGDKNVNVDFNLRSLIKKEGHIETGIIEGLVIDIESRPDGALRVGSISIPAGPDQPEKKEDMSWLFRADHVELKNCEVRYNLPQLRHTLLIDHGVLNNIFTGRANSPGTVELEGSVNGTPVSLNLDRIELQPQLVVGGHISVKGYSLAALQDLLSDVLQPFSGKVGIDGDVLFSLEENGAISTNYKGKLNVAGIDIGNSGFSTQSPLLAYTGTVNYTQAAGAAIGIELDGLLQGDQVKVGVPAAELELLEHQFRLEGQTTISVDNGVTVATDGSLGFTGLSLAMPSMDVSHAGSTWQGRVEYALAGNSGKQTIAANGKLALKAPRYTSSGDAFALQTGADKLAWDGRIDVDLGTGDSGKRIVTNGLLSGDTYQLTIPDLLDFSEQTILVNGKTELIVDQNLKLQSRTNQQHRDIRVLAGSTESHGSMTWQGRVDYVKKGFDSQLLLDGKLDGRELDAELKDQQLKISQQELAFVPQQLRLNIGKQLRLDGIATIAGKRMQVEKNDAALVQVESIAVGKIRGAEKAGVRVDEISVKEVRMPSGKGRGVEVQIPDIAIRDISSPDYKKVTVARVNISKPLVLDGTGKAVLAALDGVTVKTITVDNPLKVSVASVTADNGSFLKKEGPEAKPVITLKEATAQTITWSDKNGLFCDTIALDTVRSDYVRTAKKDDATEEKKPEQKEKSEKGPTMPVRINSIAVTGNSGFTFTDQTTSVPFFTEFVLQNSEVNNIDLAAPDKPFPYTLKGTFDTWSPFDISGTCAPLADAFVVKAKIRLRNYSLEKISPYVIDTIGTKFVDGQLYITSDLSIDGDKLDLDNNLVCREIKAQTVSEEAQGALSLPVSLDMALSMLRDNNGDIDLDMPVSGTLSDFSVGKADIIITALSKAIVVAVTPYLAYSALGPAGAVAYVGLKAGQEAMKDSFPLLEFADQVTELSSKQQTTLSEIGKKIEADKGQDYAICSKAMVWELDPGTEKTVDNQKTILQDKARKKTLLDLSRKRAVATREFLLDRFSLDTDHLLICPPAINYELTGKPYVKIRKLGAATGIQGMLP